MTRTTISRTLAVTPHMEEAWRAVGACFGRFCLTVGVEALQAMMAADVENLAAEAERLIRDLARRMEKEAPGVSSSILEGLGEMLTVNRLRLPPELRRSLACTNAIENMQGTIRRVTRNVKHWCDASMALRWAAAGMLEAKAGFRRLIAYRQLPALRRALAEHHPRRLDPPG